MDIASFLYRAVHLFPQNLAVIDEGVRFSYAQLELEVRKIALAIRTIFPAKGHFCVLSYNSANFLLLSYALAYARMVMVPVNWRCSAEELAFIIQNANCSGIYVGLGLEDLWTDIENLMASPLNVIIFESDPQRNSLENFCRAITDEDANHFRISEVDEHDTAIIMYTSGTTGRPKGAVLTHRNIVSNAYHLLVMLGEADLKDKLVYLHACPMFHAADGPTTHRITWLGGTHIIMKKFTAEKAFEYIERYNISSMMLIPTMINSLNQVSPLRTNVSSMKKLMFGGAPCATEILINAMRIFTQCEFIQIFGSTELSPMATYMPQRYIDPSLSSSEIVAKRLKSCGLPVPGVSVEIMNDKHELIKKRNIIGPNVMKCYYDNPAATAKSIIDGWYLTGDVGYIDEEGFVYIVDRVKDMIISGGENIYCSEVENCIFSHPSVQEATVFGIPHDHWGEIPKAYVVLKKDHQLSENQLIQYCRSKIAHYKVPHAVKFVESLPKGGTNKILKRTLRDPYWEKKQSKL